MSDTLRLDIGDAAGLNDLAGKTGVFAKAVLDLGFKSVAEFHALIASRELTGPGNFAAFKRWQNEDGSKAGLLALPAKPEEPELDALPAAAVEITLKPCPFGSGDHHRTMIARDEDFSSGSRHLSVSIVCSCGMRGRPAIQAGPDESEASITERAKGLWNERP